MVNEGAYGQLKERLRVLFRRNDCSQKNVQNVTMACIVLHNVCINHGDLLSGKTNLTIEHFTVPDAILD